MNIKLYDPDRHEALRPTPWNPERLEAYSQSILAQTLARYSPAVYWPVHDLDIDSGDKPSKGFNDFYYGAGGNFWLLDYCKISITKQFELFLNDLQLEVDENASIFLDRIAFLLFKEKISPSQNTRDELLKLIQLSLPNEKNEILFGSPSTLLLTFHAYKLSGDSRFLEACHKLKTDVWRKWEPNESLGCHAWIQHFSTSQTFYGAAHGTLGNLQVLFTVREILTDEENEELMNRAVIAFEKMSVKQQGQANWAMSFEHQEKFLLHWCHGSPGAICSLSDHIRRDHKTDQLLEDAGELIWLAGPLKKGTSLCHGTSGNAIAFLKLYQRTKKEIWLDRAKSFAMHCLEQCEEMKTTYGDLRFSLWTGDLGLVWLNEQIKNQTANLPFLDIY